MADKTSLNSNGIINRIQQLSKKISSTIVGSSDFEDIINIEKSMKRLKNVVNLNDTSKLSSLVNSLASNSNNKNSNSYEELLKSLGINFSAVSVEQDRISRYREYEAITIKIPYVKRAIEVLVQNILEPDDNSKKSLTIINEENANTNDIQFKTNYDNIKNFIKTYELENYIKDITLNVLKLGDYFVEIVEVDSTLRNYKLTEGTIDYNYNDKNKKVKFIVEGLEDNKNSNKDYFNINTKKQDIFLNYLSPAMVVKLGDKFCLGYIVFPYNSSKISGVKDSMDAGKVQVQMMDDSSYQIQGIVDKLVSKIKGNRNIDLSNTKDELKTIIAKLLIQSQNKEIIARYVKPENMEHFNISTLENAPYGTSLLYGTEFLARIMIAIQSSIMVQRMTRSVERRVIKVELGATRDAQKYIEAFKEKMERRKFTVDTNGSVDTVASQLATFEDMYIPMRNGRTLVEFEAIPPQGELSSRVEDLKSIRDELIAGLYVPPAYLSVEENIESKNTLSQQNVIFANTILNYQKSMSQHLTSLLHKAFKITDPNNKNIDDFQISFNPPTALFAEKHAEYYQTVATIINTLKDLDVPKKYIIEKYLKPIDWNKVKEENISEKINSIQNNNNEEENENNNKNPF